MIQALRALVTPNPADFVWIICTGTQGAKGETGELCGCWGAQRNAVPEALGDMASPRNKAEKWLSQEPRAKVWVCQLSKVSCRTAEVPPMPDGVMKKEQVDLHLWTLCRVQWSLLQWSMWLFFPDRPSQEHLQHSVPKMWGGG